MLVVRDLDTRIGATEILRGVSLDVPDGAMCGVIGRNGAGKTTLLRSIMGALATRGGSIELAGRDITAVAGHVRSRMGIGYMPEDRRLVAAFSVEENILLPTWAAGQRDGRTRLEWIYSVIPEMAERRRQKVNQLSGGQQKMVALARAMMAARRLLILDEPLEGLAPALARRLAEVMASLKTESMSVLLADSNEQHVIDLFDRIFRIERGAITASE